MYFIRWFSGNIMSQKRIDIILTNICCQSTESLVSLVMYIHLLTSCQNIPLGGNGRVNMMSSILCLVSTFPVFVPKTIRYISPGSKPKIL